MPTEIERKFLVNEKQLPPLPEPDIIKQGFLSIDPDRTVRVRTSYDGYGTLGCITIKGRKVGPTCAEYEYDIPVGHAEDLLDDMCIHIVEKKRYYIMHEGYKWEVDIFEGDNKGLIVAELELSTEDEKFPFPDWVAKEVTDDYRYVNSKLGENPYKNWPCYNQ